MTDILDQIVLRKRERLDALKSLCPLAELRTQAQNQGTPRGFITALQRPSINIIAEAKRCSPSKGIIRENFDPVEVARNYTANGAAAISVLTEEDYFDGSLEYLKAVRAATDLPLLRKDFIFDEYQIWEALVTGADAILLIAAMLEAAQFNDLMQTAYGLGLDVLVEIHNREEAEKVLAYDVRLLGVNNRNLRTFKTTLDTSLDLARELPRSITLVSESGIRTREDIETLRSAGYHAFLIGEEFMRAEDEGQALKELIG
ncbi:MAG TPA: indole-3-glycerol phosphate synthase TrpC [Blastocatellia bacterium]|nr:indole-3-glycerol phosphate synthase TrpC [Blastocatellia bacterium]